MDFGELRAQAIEQVQAQLRGHMRPDEILKHLWRIVANRPDALEHWLFCIAPEMEPNKARDAFKKGRTAWNGKATGADMDDLAWKQLAAVCKNKQPDIDAYAKFAAPNLHALLGPYAAAELVDAGGSLQSIAFMTQRDVLELGNESGMFGGKQKLSILKKHSLATTERALRVLASRTVLAARLDHYKGNFKGESLRQEVLYAQ